jgi:hypothetical protein
MEKTPLLMDPYVEACTEMRKSYPFLILTSDWILPQWLKYYKKLLLILKLLEE